jgi:hypothetical protein
MFPDAPKRRVLVSEANRTIPDPAYGLRMPKTAGFQRKLEPLLPFAESSPVSLYMCHMRYAT